MSRLRSTLAVSGVVLAGVGFAMVLDRGLAGGLTLTEIALIPVALLALFQGVRTVQDRRRTSLSLAETGDPETEQELPAPGDDFDRKLDRVGRLQGSYGARQREARSRERIDDRIERAAVATLTRRLGCTENDAQALLGEGTWTDDPVAAAFFTGELRGFSLSDRLRYVLDTTPRYRRRAIHAADAVAAIADGASVPEAGRRTVVTDERRSLDPSDRSGSDSESAPGTDEVSA